MSKQREEFLNWHFLDWKSSNANDDSIDFARDLYDRVHKHSHNQFFRARELKAWQQAQKVAVPDGFVLVEVTDLREIISTASDAMMDEKTSSVYNETGDPSTWFDHYTVAEKRVLDMIEAQENST